MANPEIKIETRDLRLTDISVLDFLPTPFGVEALLIAGLLGAALGIGRKKALPDQVRMDQIEGAQEQVQEQLDDTHFWEGSKKRRLRRQKRNLENLKGSEPFDSWLRRSLFGGWE